MKVRSLLWCQFMSTERKEYIDLKQSGQRKTVEARVFGHKPSWKVYGKGSCRAEISMEKDGSLYIIASETAFGDKRDVTKEVFVSVPFAAVKLLQAIINDHPLLKPSEKLAALAPDMLDTIKQAEAYTSLNSVCSPPENTTKIVLEALRNIITRAA